MTRSQQVHYRARLWPAACTAQGWQIKDEAKRRQVTQEATGQDSTSGLTNKQVDRLFRRLEWLADPGNFDAAFADANPELADAAADRQRVIWRIEQAATARDLSPAYLDTLAAGKCRKHRAKTWRDLPQAELVKFSMTVHSRGTAAQPVQPPCNEDASQAGPSFMDRARSRLGHQ